MNNARCFCYHYFDLIMDLIDLIVYIIDTFLCFRIFVNRSLHLENVKFYGFDMDYTLAGTFYLIFIIVT